MSLAARASNRPMTSAAITIAGNASRASTNT
jgi:hypothetical protein